MTRAVRVRRAVFARRSLVAVSAGIAAGFLGACGGGSEPAAQSPPRAAETATAGGTAVKPYPLDVCLVGNEKIGGMGDPVVEVYKGQQFKFCCADCVKEFKAKPEEFVAKLAAATQAGSDAHAGHEDHGGAAH